MLHWNSIEMHSIWIHNQLIQISAHPIIQLLILIQLIMYSYSSNYWNEFIYSIKNLQLTWTCPHWDIQSSVGLGRQHFRGTSTFCVHHQQQQSHERIWSLEDGTCWIEDNILIISNEISDWAQIWEDEWDKILLGRGIPADIKMHGQMTQWNQIISFPMIWTSAGQ